MQFCISRDRERPGSPSGHHALRLDTRACSRVAGLALDYTSFDNLSDATLLAAHKAGIEDVHGLGTILNAGLTYAYGITDDLTVTVRLPYVRRTGIREVEHFAALVPLVAAGRAPADGGRCDTQRLLQDGVGDAADGSWPRPLFSALDDAAQGRRQDMQRRLRRLRKECEMYAKAHAVCKACAASCEACIKDCKKVIDA